MRLFATILFTILTICTASAQTRANRYIDVVYPFKGDAVEGTVLTYDYGERVILVKDNGSVVEFPWEKVKRVNFRFDRKRPAGITIEESVEAITQEEVVLVTPKRKIRHQITSALTFGRTTNNVFGRREFTTALGGGVAYHLLKDLSFLTVGGGLDLNLMNHQRRENVIAATVLVEYLIGRGRFRPFARMESGPSFPFGGEEGGERITSRSVTLLYHPAVGIEITPRNGGWGKMTLDVGYRFLNSRFDLTTENLDVVERNVQYRRLTVRGGMRF